jgi:hypothetical protein
METNVQDNKNKTSSNKEGRGLLGFALFYILMRIRKNMFSFNSEQIFVRMRVLTIVNTHILRHKIQLFIWQCLDKLKKFVLQVCCIL